MTAKNIKLSRTYTELGRPFSDLAFRVPRWNDFVDLGDIEEWQPIETADGEPRRFMLVRYPDVVAKYAERCVQEPASAAHLAILDLVDTIAVHEAIKDFFSEARPSRPTQTGSSGGTAKASKTSGA